MYPKNIVKRVVNVALSKKGEDIKVFKIDKKTTIADYLIITTSRSSIQTKAIMEAIYENLKGKTKPLHIEDGKGWTLMDYGSVIVNIFEEEQRDFYQLETLWADTDEIKI